MLNRRTFLGAALAAGGGSLLSSRYGTSVGAATIQRASAVAPAGSDLGAIEHVVFLMQENRSFDHYYGSYPGVRGFDDHPSGSLGNFAQSWPGRAQAQLLPFHLSSSSGIGECTRDLGHSWLVEHDCWDKGNNADFVSTHTSSSLDIGPEYGVLTMGYYQREDLPFYYGLADVFTICDNYHCSILGPTHPNRLMQMTGTNDPAGIAGGPVLTTNLSPDAVWSVSWETMPEVLEDAGISWKVYGAQGSPSTPTAIESAGVSLNVLAYFSQYKNASSSLFRNAFSSEFSNFISDVNSNTLPAVSWIIPSVDCSEHPPYPPALGEWFTGQVLQALVWNPDVWSKTVLFHMYDENEGSSITFLRPLHRVALQANI
jgi:phospholipase C